jgi:hypothetical protein
LIAPCTSNLPRLADPRDRVARLLRLADPALALGPQAGDRDATCAAAPRGVRWLVVFAPADPAIAAIDRHAGARAVRAISAELDRANRLECAHVAIDLGALTGLAARWHGLLDAFARGTLDHSTVRAFSARREAVASRHLDAARRGLDRLLPLCERRGAAMGLLPAAAGDALGLPNEIDGLLADYAGAPLVRWRATDREHGLVTLGLDAAARRAAGAVLLADAAGCLGGLPPGAGEVDWAAALRDIDDGAPRVLRAGRATERELVESMPFLADAASG